MSQLAFSDLFEYLCYGSTAITHMFIHTVRGSTLDDPRYRRQILTTKFGLRAVRVNRITTSL